MKCKNILTQLNKSLNNINLSTAWYINQKWTRVNSTGDTPILIPNEFLIANWNECLILAETRQKRLDYNDNIDSQRNIYSNAYNNTTDNF